VNECSGTRGEREGRPDDDEVS